jgi:hypothetical protein
MRVALRTLVVLAIAAGTLRSADDAEACSCVARTFAQHAKAEKRVMLVRAGKPVKTGDHLTQTFAVLATFKGAAQPQFLLDRPVTPPCASAYADGEIAILFTSGGDLDLCHGNVPIASQVDDLPAILKATGTKRGAAKPDALEAALRDVLPKYLHGRPQVTIRHAPLAGTSFEIDTSHLTYARTATDKDVQIKQAFTADSITYIEGSYGTEGLQFTVLVHFDGAWKVLGSWVAET